MNNLTADPTYIALGPLLEFITEQAHLCPNCGDVDRTAYVDAHALELFLQAQAAQGLLFGRYGPKSDGELRAALRDAVQRGNSARGPQAARSADKTRDRIQAELDRRAAML